MLRGRSGTRGRLPPPPRCLSLVDPNCAPREIADAAGALYRRWHPSHGIDVNDAILAATAAATGGKIYTQNVKHYPMPDVAVIKGW